MWSLLIVKILLGEVTEKSLVIVKKIVKARYDFFHDSFPDVEKIWKNKKQFGVRRKN